MKIKRAQGNGQGFCKLCEERGKWNRSWMCFFWEIEGKKGVYCRDCVREILRKGDIMIEELIRKIINGEYVNRSDEAILHEIATKLFGDGNVLTEIEIDDHKTVYFGCAIRRNGKWTVYNLIGDKKGVVVKLDNRFTLLVRED